MAGRSLKTRFLPLGRHQSLNSTLFIAAGTQTRRRRNVSVRASVSEPAAVCLVKLGEVWVVGQFQMTHYRGLSRHVLNSQPVAGLALMSGEKCAFARRGRFGHRLLSSDLPHV